MSYQYHAMSNFFNRDNVGLQGFAAFYRVSSLEERAHAPAANGLPGTALQCTLCSAHCALRAVCMKTISCVAPELCLKASPLQATRGGRVKLAALAAPPPDYNHEQKGDALYSMEIALALEKLNFQMLYSLHETADKAGDAQMTDFVEEMLAEQVCLVWRSCARQGMLESSTVCSDITWLIAEMLWHICPLVNPCCSLLHSAIHLRHPVSQSLDFTKNKVH